MVTFSSSGYGSSSEDIIEAAESSLTSGLAFGPEDEKRSIVKKPKKVAIMKSVAKSLDKDDEEGDSDFDVSMMASTASGLEAVEGDVSSSGASGQPRRRRWYIIHTYSGQERRIESMEMGHKVFRVEVPQKPVTKIKDGKRIEKDEHLFPGYVLVEMFMDDDSWYCVRYTPGVTKFVGGEKKPLPVKDTEIKRILFRGQQTTAPKIEVDLKVGEHIQIISGPFQDFEGTVTEVSAEKLRLKASVSIFGRETPVELQFNQIKKK
jgi:transcription termination/antitermination protein NusG